MKNEIKIQGIRKHCGIRKFKKNCCLEQQGTRFGDDKETAECSECSGMRAARGPEGANQLCLC